ncbi:MAG: hypothetical protein RI558_04580 [Psychroflexus sp.]|jgi:uncharacterized protein HemX|nr:hypothetical protein [Psychroflexus sp.]MDR9448470.1 hypothetical protein [Psychroflexus sp.]
MKPEELNKLLDKYERAETSLEEERRIKDHYAQQKPGDEDDEYNSIFALYKQEQNKSIPELSKPKASKTSFTWMKIAAVFVMLLAGAVFYQQYQNQQEIKRQQAREAFDQTKKVLQLVATEFQKGKSNLVLLKDINQTKNEFIK